MTVFIDPSTRAVPPLGRDDKSNSLSLPAQDDTRRRCTGISISALRIRLCASVSEELEQLFLSSEVVDEIARYNTWAARFQAGYGIEDRKPRELMVSQEVDQLQGLETVEPSVKLGFESRVMCRVLLQARPDFFKTIELEELPQLG